jgi:hypothetical protein
VVGGDQVGGWYVLMAGDAGDERDDLVVPGAASGDGLVDDADADAGQVGDGDGAGGELVLVRDPVPDLGLGAAKLRCR